MTNATKHLHMVCSEMVVSDRLSTFSIRISQEESSRPHHLHQTAFWHELESKPFGMMAGRQPAKTASQIYDAHGERCCVCHTNAVRQALHVPTNKTCNSKIVIWLLCNLQCIGGLRTCYESELSAADMYRHVCKIHRLQVCWTCRNACDATKAASAVCQSGGKQNELHYTK